MLDIDGLISEEIMHKSAKALEGWPIADCDMPDAAGTVLSAGGPGLVAAALRYLTTLRAFKDVQGDLVELANQLDAPELKNWWVSWYAPAAESKIGFEYHGPWWVTGSRGTQDTVVAAVQAPTADAARQVIIDTHDAGLTWLEWRFVEEHPADWNPFASDRFPRADWMRWPYPAEA